jgi:hypothetical protein
MRQKINAGIISMVLAFFCSGAFAQATTDAPESEDLLHYSYSTILGTGWYKVGDRRVALLEAPFFWQLRDTAENTRIGYRILLPVAAGFYNFASEAPIPDSDDVATLSFVPGLELLIPIAEDWLIKPYGQLGFGMDIQSSENAAIYAGGIKARYQAAEMTFETPGITYGIKGDIAGYSPENGNNDKLGVLAFGFDVQFPLNTRIGNRLNFIGLSLYGNYYYTEAEFANFIDDTDEVESDVTVELSLGGKPDFELMGVPFERLGLGYRRGGELRAITLVTSFPF